MCRLELGQRSLYTFGSRFYLSFHWIIIDLCLATTFLDLNLCVWRFPDLTDLTICACTPVIELGEP